MFLITSLVYALGALLYALMASGEKQDWAEPQIPLIDSEKVRGQVLKRGGDDANNAAGL